MVSSTATERLATAGMADTMGDAARTAGARSRSVLVSVAATVAALVLAAPALASPGTTTRASISSSGVQANNDSASQNPPSISGDGSLTAFESRASNLIDGQVTRPQGVFVRNAITGTTALASVAADGSPPATGDSEGPSIAAGGRYVAFASESTNLVAGDTNGQRDVFVRNLQAGTTVRVSVANNGDQSTGFNYAPSISANGRFVAFLSFAANMLGDGAGGGVLVRDRDADGNGTFDEPGATATSTTRMSVALDGTPSGIFDVGPPAISADGRFVVFRSSTTNLVANDTNGAQDIFRRDRQAGTTTLVSVATDGTQSNGFSTSPAISGDGTQVAFRSNADTLVPEDTNLSADIFVRDVSASKTVRVSVKNDGTQSSGFAENPSLSFDGRLVSFYSDGADLVSPNVGNTFVRDRDANTNRVFDEPGTGATTTTVESVKSDGTPPNAQSFLSAISADGSQLAFASTATDLVAADTNLSKDVFVHTLSVPAGLRSLSVERVGDGSGTVTSSPAGIACGSLCSKYFVLGERVTLTATPVAGSSFTGFTGDCSGVSTCTVTLDQARSVTATFTLDRRVLTVVKAGAGLGTVTSSPVGISCGSDCSENYLKGAQVTLRARPQPGGFPSNTFAGFSGAGCSGSALTCTVSVDEAKSVTATFELTRHTLTVSKSGDGQGTVSSSPAGISCGPDCSVDYLEGEIVTLTATADSGSVFLGFSGACGGSGACTVTVDQARAVTANFESTSPGPGPNPAPAPGPTPGSGSGPPPGPPVVVPKPARVSVAGFTARVSPARDRRVQYRFTVSGAVRRPAGVAASACKGGRVSVQTKVGSKTISTRRVALKSNCTYRVVVTFANRSRLGRGRLTLRVRFLGNDRFKPAVARTLSVRAG